MENLEKLLELALLNIDAEIKKLQNEVEAIKTNLTTINEKLQKKEQPKNEKMSWLLGDK